MERDNRLKVLNENEYNELYGYPGFSIEERSVFFSLSDSEVEERDKLRSVSAKIFFILQTGYFTAKRIFFTLDAENSKDDILFIIDRYYPDFSMDNLSVTGRVRLFQQKTIADMSGYRVFRTPERKLFAERAAYLAKIHSNPAYIFNELKNYLDNEKIILPVYSFFQDVIGKAISDEIKRCGEYIIKKMNKSLTEKMEDFLSAEDNSLYSLTLIKKEPVNFTNTEIMQEVKKRQSLKPLYSFADKVLKELELSSESIKYYSSLVSYYSVYKLKRTNSITAYLYLLCFVHNRFQQCNDNLINSFIYHVNGYFSDADKYAVQAIFEQKISGSKNLKKAGQILELFLDDKISGDTAFSEIKQKAFSILEKDEIPRLTDFMKRKHFDKKEHKWDYIAMINRKIKLNLRQIFISLDFQSNTEKPLMDAIYFLKECFSSKTALTSIDLSAFPTEFIRHGSWKYLDCYKVKVNGREKTVRRLSPDRYEYHVYQVIAHRLSSGDIFLRDSISYRSFEDDLVDDKTWENKDRIIEELNLPFLKRPVDEILAELEEKLETRFHYVNRRIRGGKNRSIKITETGKWVLSDTRTENDTNHPVLAQMQQAGIADILNFVDRQCNFMSLFPHIRNINTSGVADKDSLTACLVSMGTNQSLTKMSEISDLTYSKLSATYDNYIRPETLKNAIDCINNATHRLPVSKLYNINNLIHSSSDGQKFDSRDTVNARHSPKYFGLGKGVSVVTLNANHIPLNATNIGANEHESHYVFDLLYNNTSDIIPDIHSTDTHGANKINFGILLPFGHRFAPRFKDLKERMKDLCGFRNLSHYRDMFFKPADKVNIRLIKSQWDNILRIFVSLALKTTTQSTIVRKLSSYSRKNRTKEALWEFNRIIMSVYLLEYVDSADLRRDVQKALNRGESYHSLKSAIFSADKGKFKVKTVLEQEIWSECSRLLCSAVIYYNSYILSELMKDLPENERAFFSKISPAAWNHINIYGRYVFSSSNELDIDSIVRSLKNKVGSILKEKVQKSYSSNGQTPDSLQ